MKLARLAQEAAPSFMQPRVRLALFLYKDNPTEHIDEIKQELSIAFNALPSSVAIVDRDPDAREIRGYVSELRQNARDRIDRNISALGEALSQADSSLFEKLGTSRI